MSSLNTNTNVNHSPMLASRQVTGRLQISNLSAEVTRCALVSYFGQLGELVDVRLAISNTALVTYADMETAQAVVDMKVGHSIEGCPVFVEMAISYAVTDANLCGGSRATSTQEEEARTAPSPKMQSYSAFSGTNFFSRAGSADVLALPTPDLNPGSYVEEACKLFITQIPQHVTKSDIKKYFKQFGKLNDVYMPGATAYQGQAAWGSQHKGIAFLTFRNKSLGDVVLQRAEYEVVPGVTVIVDKAKTRKDCLKPMPTTKSQKKSAKKRAAAAATPY